MASVGGRGRAGIKRRPPLGATIKAAIKVPPSVGPQVSLCCHGDRRVAEWCGEGGHCAVIEAGFYLAVGGGLCPCGVVMVI